MDSIQFVDFQLFRIDRLLKSASEMISRIPKSIFDIHQIEKNGISPSAKRIDFSSTK